MDIIPGPVSRPALSKSHMAVGVSSRVLKIQRRLDSKKTVYSFKYGFNGRISYLALCDDGKHIAICFEGKNNFFVYEIGNWREHIFSLAQPFKQPITSISFSGEFFARLFSFL